MRHLLSQLNKEMFILDTKESITGLPEVAGYGVSQVGEHCLEVEVEKGQSLNELFEQLSRAGLHIVSMRNKANRLEELFVSLVSTNNKEAAQ